MLAQQARGGAQVQLLTYLEDLTATSRELHGCEPLTLRPAECRLGARRRPSPASLELELTQALLLTGLSLWQHHFSEIQRSYRQAKASTQRRQLALEQLERRFAIERWR
jgi:hypothetical protein